MKKNNEEENTMNLFDDEKIEKKNKTKIIFPVLIIIIILGLSIILISGISSKKGNYKKTKDYIDPNTNGLKEEKKEEKKPILYKYNIDNYHYCDDGFYNIEYIDGIKTKNGGIILNEGTTCFLTYTIKYDKSDGLSDTVVSEKCLYQRDGIDMLVDIPSLKHIITSNLDSYGKYEHEYDVIFEGKSEDGICKSYNLGKMKLISSLYSSLKNKGIYEFYETEEGLYYDLNGNLAIGDPSDVKNPIIDVDKYKVIEKNNQKEE